ncbi:helix-turn-helix domain-containing protein [Corynebacterium sp. AOP40-9SA-29]|uniref:helix-turn-helix domain-containing protein n=1 Tax=Corynebacterium sp. AOP40-9SA-29 TaxID=3457677 RepID=UPI0040337D38
MALGRMEAFDKDVFLDLFEQSGKTQAQLAVDCQVGRAVVSNWVAGRNKPAPQAAPLLAEALGTTVLILSNRTPEDADLVDRRISKGFNAASAAREAGITSQQIYELEQAVSMPIMEQLDALAPVYDLTTDEIHRAWINRRVRLFPGSLRHLDDTTREALKPWSHEEPEWATPQ